MSEPMSTSRRSLLTGAMAAASLPASSATATNDADAALIRRCAEFLSADALQRALNAESAAWPRVVNKEVFADFDCRLAACLTRWRTTLQAVIDTPVTTLPGLIAKARASRAATQEFVKAGPAFTNDNGEPHERLAWALATDVLGLESVQ